MGLCPVWVYVRFGFSRALGLLPVWVHPWIYSRFGFIPDCFGVIRLWIYVGFGFIPLAVDLFRLYFPWFTQALSLFVFLKLIQALGLFPIWAYSGLGLILGAVRCIPG